MCKQMVAFKKKKRLSNFGTIFLVSYIQIRLFILNGNAPSVSVHMHKGTLMNVASAA